MNQAPGGSAAPPTGETMPQRQRPAHLPNIARFNQPVIVSVTVCAKQRRAVLASERVLAALKDAWSEAGQYSVGRFMLMPDHVHLFCSPAVAQAENVKRWVAYWKRLASLQLKDIHPLWQRDCWDTQLRDAGHYGEKWDYVVRNPVRKGLVPRPEDWAYHGCLNELRW